MLLMLEKIWTVFTVATTISITITSILSFCYTTATALPNNSLFFNNQGFTDWIKQCVSSTGNSANINNNPVNSGSASDSLFASSNDPALYCNQLLQDYISQTSTWLQQCTSAALTSRLGGGFVDAMRYCTYLYQLTQNNNFLTQNQNNNGITIPLHNLMSQQLDFCRNQGRQQHETNNNMRSINQG
jgi:hypothetical protein